MSFTNYLENSVLNHIFGGGDYSRSSTLQIGLSTTSITEDGTNITEPSGGSYAKVQINNDANAWENAITDAGSKGKKTNKIEIEFPEATDNWGEIIQFFITDGTNVLGYGSLLPPRSILTGDTARFKAGELVITLD